jgi:rod shape-determining protein MreB
LDETPPELVSDLMETGICLAGGGGQLKGLAGRISEETHIRAWVAQDALTCVARGAGMVLEDFDVLKATLSSDESWRAGGSASW